MKRSAKTVGPIYVYAFGIVMDAHGMFDLYASQSCNPQKTSVYNLKYKC